MSVVNPNMGLLSISIGTDTGLQIETNSNANTAILDGHNHSSGQGVQINPSGININTNLPFNNSSATSLKSAVFQAQNPLGTLLALYVIGPDIYYNDGNGNVVRLTQSGAVNATSSGISSGTATASFLAGVLIVNAAALTPANIQVASVLLGNNVASSKFLTLSPPSAMASNFGLVLPTVPAVAGPMTLDASGNMGSTTYDAVGQAMTSVGANAIAASRTRAVGSTVGVGGVALSASVVGYTLSSGSTSAITSVTITTSGRPVVIKMIPSPGLLNANIDISTGGSTSIGTLFFLESGATQIGEFSVGLSTVSADLNVLVVPVASLSYMDFPVAGTYTYTISANNTSPGLLRVDNCSLVAYEL